MKPNFFATSLLALAVLTSFEAERASAIEINFSGVITEAVPGNYGVEVGDRFSGYLIYDVEVFPSSGQFDAAVIDIQTASPSPDIVFYYPNSTLTIGDGICFLIGNPYDFFGSLSLYMDASGAVTGGSLYLNSEPLKNNGAFSGIINVPESAATAALLAIGLISLAWFRRASRAGRRAEG